MQLRNLPQNIKVRLITSFFNRIATSAVMPFMALFFAQEIGKVQAGVFLLCSVLASFFSNLAGGYISDRFRRKTVLIWSSGISTAMFLLMSISLMPADNIIVLFAAAYMLFMISSSLGRPSMQALIIDSTTPENRKAVYAIDYWLINLSLAIGAAMGGLLYLHHRQLLFIILTIISGLICIAYRLWLQENRGMILEKKHENVFIDLFYNYKTALRDTRYVKLLLGFMFIMSAEFSLNNYIGVRLSETFVPVSFLDVKIEGIHMLSILNIQNMLLVVCLTFFVTKFASRFPDRRVLITGLLLYAAGYTLLTSAISWQTLLIFGFIATMGELLYTPVYNTQQANMIPEDKRGSYSAFSGVAFNGADLMARSSIILGAYLSPAMMSVYIGISLMIGISLIYSSIFLASMIRKRQINSTT